MTQKNSKGHKTFIMQKKPDLTDKLTDSCFYETPPETDTSQDNPFPSSTPAQELDKDETDNFNLEDEFEKDEGEKNSEQQIPPTQVFQKVDKKKEKIPSTIRLGQGPLTTEQIEKFDYGDKTWFDKSVDFAKKKVILPTYAAVSKYTMMPVDVVIGRYGIKKQITTTIATIAICAVAFNLYSVAPQKQSNQITTVIEPTAITYIEKASQKQGLEKAILLEKATKATDFSAYKKALQPEKRQSNAQTIYNIVKQEWNSAANRTDGIDEWEKHALIKKAKELSPLVTAGVAFDEESLQNQYGIVRLSSLLANESPQIRTQTKEGYLQKAKQAYQKMVQIVQDKKIKLSEKREKFFKTYSKKLDIPYQTQALALNN